VVLGNSEREKEILKEDFAGVDQINGRIHGGTFQW
jgi:hypothetical protein